MSQGGGAKPTLVLRAGNLWFILYGGGSDPEHVFKFWYNKSTLNEELYKNNLTMILKMPFSGGSNPWFTLFKEPGHNWLSLWWNISQMSIFETKIESSFCKNMARSLWKPIFRGLQGAVPPDLPPCRGLTVTIFQYNQYYPSEQHFKNPELSIFENMTRIL